MSASFAISIVTLIVAMVATWFAVRAFFQNRKDAFVFKGRLIP